MDIAGRLDKAMRDAGIASQKSLERISGVPQPTINRILKGGGKKGPETDTLLKLASATNVTVEWLREGTEPQFRGQAVPMPLHDVPHESRDLRQQLAESSDDTLMSAIRLLTLFHGTDADGRARIMKVAEKVPKILGIEIVRNQA